MKKIRRMVLSIITIQILFIVTGCADKEDKIVLTQEQNAWISEHPLIRVAPDPSFAPFEFFDEEGNYRGLSADYIQYIDDKTLLNFEIVKLENWDEVLEGLKNRTIDMSAGLAYSPQRDDYLEFSQGYIQVPGVIIARSNDNGILTVDDLNGERVSVVNDYIMHDFVKNNYPEIKLDVVKNAQEGLRNVSFGYSRAFMENLATASYYLDESRLGNLKVINTFDYELEMRMGIREDWPMLVDIINSVLEQMPQSEIDAIESNWFYADFQKTKMLEEVGLIGSILLSAVLLVIIWNITLKRKVKKQTDSLKKELELNQKYHEELKLFNEKLEEKVERRTYLLNETNRELEKSMFDMQLKNQEIEEMNKMLNQTLSEIQEMQEQLIQSEKMAALGNLVSGIAHEINTPLGIAVTAVSNIEKLTRTTLNQLETQTLSKNALDKYFRNMVESSDITMKNLENAADLIRRFKQVAVDQQTKDVRDFNLKDYIQDVIISLKPEYKNKQITFEINCEDLEISSYPGAISQIITNFIVNSIKHGFEDGVEGKIMIDVYQEKQDIIIIYADNGKGVDEAYLHKIFDPFFTTKRNKGGTGIGLNIVYNLVVDLLKGKIIAENRENTSGLLFKISFPMNKNITVID